jgi:4-diphosphocytidyl-2-C-methyl-D-erythritol kinase
MITEPAFAKLNLVLRVGRPRADGLHPICSIFASIELADEVVVEPADEDGVECPGVDGPNLVSAAVAAYRERVPDLPPLRIRIEKHIPVAAGLGGGSADAAAVLRAANRLTRDALDVAELRELAAGLGSDVPSQVEPGHALVSGVGEVVEPIQLPPRAAVLVPQPTGLSTAAVYAEFDRLGLAREELDCDELRHTAPAADALHNDLQAPAISLRPELAGVLEGLRAAGATAALVTGSGPTCFAHFDTPAAAIEAAASIDGAIVTRLRQP